jgi:hypothetical protein
MRLKNAERAELASFIHHRLDYWDFVELFAWEVVYILDEFVLGDV